MRAVIQRVSRASVRTGDELLGEIGPGMLVLLCVMRGDGPEQARTLAERIARFRFFPDAQDRMNVSALDAGCSALVVSQFTLAHDGSQKGKTGRRPSFDHAAPPQIARSLVGVFVSAMRELGVPTKEGRFAARMQVELVNDGPVTFMLEEQGASPVLGAGPAEVAADPG